MSTEYELISFLTSELPKRLGDQYKITHQTRVPSAPGSSFIPDLLVTDVSSGEEYVIEIKGTATPTITASIDLPLATEASIKRMRNSLSPDDQHFVLVTPFHISPTQRRSFEDSQITVINSGNPPEVLGKLVNVIHSQLLDPHENEASG